MTWQRSIQAAVRALRRAEQDLKRELAAVQTKIAELDDLARQKSSASVNRRRAAGKQRLSPQGRAAISRAAKARWAKYRADKRKQTRRRS